MQEMKWLVLELMKNVSCSGDEFTYLIRRKVLLLREFMITVNILNVSPTIQNFLIF